MFWNSERWKYYDKNASIMNCFTCRTSFPNGANDISEMVNIPQKTGICQKDRNFVQFETSDLVQILPAGAKIVCKELQIVF